MVLFRPRTGIKLYLPLNGHITGTAWVKAPWLCWIFWHNNNWERPVYFASLGHEGTLGLENYMQLEGFAYRLVPIQSQSIGRYEAGRIETELLYDNLMNKFRWGGMNDPNVYLDDFHVRTISVIRLRTRFIQLANALINKEIQPGQSGTGSVHGTYTPMKKYLMIIPLFRLPVPITNATV